MCFCHEKLKYISFYWKSWISKDFVYLYFSQKNWKITPVFPTIILEHHKLFQCFFLLKLKFITWKFSLFSSIKNHESPWIFSIKRIISHSFSKNKNIISWIFSMKNYIKKFENFPTKIKGLHQFFQTFDQKVCFHITKIIHSPCLSVLVSYCAYDFINVVKTASLYPQAWIHKLSFI